MLNEGTVTFQIKSGNTIISTAVTSGTLINGATGNVTYSVPGRTFAGPCIIFATYNETGAYAISADASQQLMINRAALTVAANSTTRQYGSNVPAFSGTLTGVQPGAGI